MVTDKHAIRYWFVSSFGREGPYDDLGTAMGRAGTLAAQAAAKGRDDERPRVECSDGTSQALRP